MLTPWSLLEEYIAHYILIWLNPILKSHVRYTVVNNESIIDRYSISIEKLGFPSSVKKVDAALIFGPYRNTYFFVGDKYWRYNEKNMAMDAGYPKEISSVWKGVPSNVDAAITWKNGRTYFFKGMKFSFFHLYCFHAIDKA